MMVRFPGSQYSNSGSATAASTWVSRSGATLSAGSSATLSSLLLVAAEEAVLEELVADEEEVVEEVVLVSADGPESGEEQAERKRVRAAPKNRAGDLRGMKEPFREAARFVLGREVSP